jgi:predicted acetyltransferase
VNTELMRRQLDDVHQRSEPLAALFASEGSIYGRFGYGMAVYSASIELETKRSRYRRSFNSTGAVRLLERDEAVPVMRGIYQAVTPTRPGMMSTSLEWFEAQMTPTERDKDEPWFFAIHYSEEGDPDAYAVYQSKHEWPDGAPKLELSIKELQALTPQAAAEKALAFIAPATWPAVFPAATLFTSAALTNRLRFSDTASSLPKSKPPSSAICRAWASI